MRQLCNPSGYTWITTQIPEQTFGKIPDNDYICQVVSNVTGIPIEDMKSKTRAREVFTARATAMAFINENNTLGATAKHFNRHHTTVISSLISMKNLYSTDKNYRSIFDRIKQEVKLN